MKKSLLLFFLLGISGLTFSQTRVDFKGAESGSGPDLKTKFRQYQLLRIDLKKVAADLRSGSSVVELRFPGELKFEVDLADVPLLSNDYFETIGRSGKTNRTASSELRTYQGALTTGSGYVVMTIDNNFFSAVISTNGQTHYIEQAYHIKGNADPDMLVSYVDTDIIRDGQSAICSAEFTQNKVRELMPLRDGQRTRANSCETIRLAIATDFSMRTKLGSAQAVTDHVVAIMNNVSALYRHEFADNIEFTIVTIYQSDATANEPLLPNTASTAAGQVLEAFADWGSAGKFNTAYNLGQLWTNRDFDGSTIGLAYLGTICGNSGYHILQDFTGDLSSLSVMTAHEIGHNLGADHDPAGSPFIMAPAVNSTTNWSDLSRLSVDTKLGSVACLSNCTGDVIPAFSMAPFATCPGGTIQFKDKTVNGTGRNWSFEGGSPSTSGNARPVVIYPTAGAFDVILKSNDAPALLANNYVVVNNPELDRVSCLVPVGAPGDAGVKYLGINTIRASSGNATQDGSRYVDRSCQHITELKPSTTYDFTVSIGNYDGGTTPTVYETVKIYIDYNGDGAFNETDEKVSDAGGALWAGYLSYAANRTWLRFTTPANMSKNKILRLRVVTDTSTPANACYNPSRGQVEDFGVVFPENSPALPVDLISFNGMAAEGHNILKWEVTNESQMTEYVLERGENARQFAKVGSVVPANVGRQRHIYELEDDQTDHAAPGYYYRLRMDESGGHSKYSRIIFLRSDQPDQGLTLRNCETLVRYSTIHYEISSAKDRYVTVTVTDLAGNRIKAWDRFLTKGVNEFDEDVANLSAGLYLFAVESVDSQAIVKKVLKAAR